jgi:hypothetical protein
MEIAALFGFAYMTDSHMPGISPLAATAIFIDGTKDIIPTDDSQAADRMRDSAGGAYDQCPGVDECAGNVYIDYPRDFGILTQGVGYDVSRGMATDEIVKAVKKAQDDLANDGIPGNENDPIYVVGYSQGANAQSDAIVKLREEGVNTSNVTFVMLGNGARNDGGLWARLPAGVYVPFIGLDFGASTNPVTPSEDPDAPKVLLITKQYDGAGDWPKYVLMNPLSAVNAAMGFLYVHNGYYQDVDMDVVNDDLDLNNDGVISDAEITANNANTDSKYIVTRTGNVTDIVIKNQPGDLPLTQPLKDLGVPEDFIKAIDPLLRAMIDAGYERPTDGKYPTEPVHFKIFPKPGKLFHDFLAIEEGADQTGDNLEDLADANTMQLASEPAVGNSLARQGATAPAVAPPPAPAPKPIFKEEWKLPAVLQQSAPEFTFWQAPPPPPVEEVPPPVEEEVDLAPADPLLIDPDKATNESATRSTGTTTPGEGLKQLQAGVKKLVNGVVKIFTPPSAANTPEPVTTNEPTGAETTSNAETNSEGAGATTP